MNRHNFLIALAVVLLGSGMMANTTFAKKVDASASVNAEVQAIIIIAEKEVEAARIAIEKGKTLIAAIPAESPLMPDVAQVVEAASENWKVAIESLKGSKDSAARIASAPSASVASDYTLLAKVNADVALSGAKVVQIAISYVEAISTNKTESLDLIRTTMQDAVSASAQVQFNYGRVRKVITQKYSK